MTNPKMVRILEMSLGIIMLIVALLAIWDINRINQAYEEQHKNIIQAVNCNQKLTDVLRKRSDARIEVDLTTMRAQAEFVALLDDINEGPVHSNDIHILATRDAFAKASDARANPDLWTPYPDCYGPERELK